MRAIFFGTPEFAVPSLERLLDTGVAVGGVITRPDRPVGRHAAPVASPVGRFAQERELAIAKPVSLRGNAELVRELAELRPDIGVVVAYGRLLPRELLELPRHGFVNVHASLLPRWRGAAPVAAAILAGDRETGVVTMRVEQELDSGPIYLERRVRIGAGEDAASLSRRLSIDGAQLLGETVRGLEGETVRPRPQEGEISYCRPLSREDGEADWERPAEELERRLRAFTPWPGLYTFLAGDRVKILEARVGPPDAGLPGTLRIAGDRALVAAGGGTSLEILRVQRAGRSPILGVELARSAPPDARFARSAG